MWHFLVKEIQYDPTSWLLAADQGMVFVKGPVGEIIALRGSDGVQAWSAALGPGEALAGFPVFANGVVYIVTNAQSDSNQDDFRRILALDARDGKQRWSHPLERHIATLARRPAGIGASSIYLEGTEYVRNHDVRYLYSVSAQTGQVQWKYPVTTDSNGDAFSATEVGNVVYVASNGDTHLDALRVGDGQRIWRYASNANIGFGTPVVVHGVLFVKSLEIYRNGSGSALCFAGCEPPTAIYALNATTGSFYWHSAWTNMDTFSQPWVTTGLT